MDFLVGIYSVPDCPNVMRIAWDKVYKVFKTKEKEKLIISIVIIIYYRTVEGSKSEYGCIFATVISLVLV